jgi:HPt (histidine-containing phosphotransfer) domain-containing protein
MDAPETCGKPSDEVFSGTAGSLQYPSAMPQPVIDPQAIDNLRMLNPDDGDEFLREIVAIFVSDTPKRLAELDESLASGDGVKFVRAAHSIKGSSSNLGALALRHAAEILEQHAKQSGLAGVAPMIGAVRTEFTRAEQELARLVKLP